MVLGLLAAVVAGPAVLGITEGVRLGQTNNKRDEHRGRRCQLIVTCLSRSGKSQQINGRQIVLRNSKLYIDTVGDEEKSNGFPFAGNYFPYPDRNYEGLVSRISDEPPILNWIYVDLNTYEVKYGIRRDAQPHLTGPFDCTRQDRRVTLEEWEGFAAVEENPGEWALYYDRESNGLESKIEGKKVLEVELVRKEKRWVKNIAVRVEQQAVGNQTDVESKTERSKQQTTATTTTNGHNLTPRFRQKLSDLSKVEPAEDRISELVLVALGGNETFYIAYKTRAGDIRQDSFDLNPGLHAFLFPEDGSTRDFSTLQVVMNWGWTYYAQDKNGRVYEKLPPNLDKVVKAREDQSEWPRTLALGPNYSYVYIGSDDHVEMTLVPQQKELQGFLQEPDNVQKVEYIFLDPYNDWRNYMMCFSDGTWTAFFHAHILNGQLNEAVKRVSGRIGGGGAGAGSAASKKEIEKLKAELGELEARRAEDLKKQKEELTTQYEKLEKEHADTLSQQKNTPSNEEINALKAQHQKELDEQKKMESHIQAQHEMDMKEQKAAYEEKLKAKGASQASQTTDKEHEKALEQLKKDYEAKLAAKDAEIKTIAAKSLNGEYSSLSAFSIVPTPMTSIMPSLGTMTAMFEDGNYQLGKTVDVTFGNNNQ